MKSSRIILTITREKNPRASMESTPPPPCLLWSLLEKNVLFCTRSAQRSATHWRNHCPSLMVMASHGGKTLLLQNTGTKSHGRIMAEGKGGNLLHRRQIWLDLARNRAKSSKRKNWPSMATCFCSTPTRQRKHLHTASRWRKGRGFARANPRTTHHWSHRFDGGEGKGLCRQHKIGCGQFRSFASMNGLGHVGSVIPLHRRSFADSMALP